MANSWLRLYHDMPNDPKWRTIARAAKQTIPVVLAVYVHLLTIASGAIERGTLVNVNSEDLASALDVDTQVVEAVLVAMQGKVLEGSKLSGWEKRQYEREDGAAERAKAWRDKKKQEREAERKRTFPNAANGSRTQTNVSERNRTPDKRREEEIKKEQVQKPTAAVAAVELPEWVDREVWDAYLEMRKKKRAIPTDKAITGILKQLGIFRNKGHDPNAVLETSTRSNWTDVYEPKPGAGNGTFKSKSESSFDALKRSLEAGRNQGASDEAVGAEAGEDSGAGVRGLLGRPDEVRPDGHTHGPRVISGT